MEIKSKKELIQYLEDFIDNLERGEEPSFIDISESGQNGEALIEITMMYQIEESASFYQDMEDEIVGEMEIKIRFPELENVEDLDELLENYLVAHGKRIGCL